jgi:hypothetical protein
MTIINNNQATQTINNSIPGLLPNDGKQPTPANKYGMLFYISRVKLNKEGNVHQIRCGEYVGKGDGEIKALATVHFQHEFLSGIPSYYLIGEGVYKTPDSKPGEAKNNWTINFTSSLMEKLMKQVNSHKEGLAKPPKDENGKSLLKGYQLIIWFKEDAVLSFKPEDKGFGGSSSKWEKWTIDPSEVESIELVTSSSNEWISTGTRVLVETAYESLGLIPVAGNTVTTLEGLKALKEATPIKRTGVHLPSALGKIKSLDDGDTSTTKPVGLPVGLDG